MEERVDERAGLSTKVIIDSKDVDKRPRISIKDTGGQTARLSATLEARYLLPVGAHINVQEGQSVYAGDALAKIPRETTKTKDITGVLPRVAELFEARKPKEFAVISEIDGVVSFGKDTKGKRKVVITPEIGGNISFPKASTSAYTKATASKPARLWWTARPTRTIFSTSSARRRWRS